MNEFFYAFYLFSGFWDSFLTINGINFYDLGIITSALLSIIIIVNLLYSIKIKLPIDFIQEFSILLIVLLLAIISLVYSQSDNYGKYKTAFFAKEIILSFGFPFFVKNFNIKRFIHYLIIIAFISNIVYFIELQIIPYTAENRIFRSRYLNLAIVDGIIFFLMFFSKEKVYKSDFVQYSFGILALIFLVLTGARGPAVFLALLLILVFIGKGLYLKVKKSVLVYLTFICIIIMPFVIYFLLSNPHYANLFDKMISRSFSRLSRFIGFITGASFDESSYERILFWKFAISQIFISLRSVLFGYGIGSFGIMYFGHDMRAYPHNIFLEAWFELGILGIILFILFFAIPLVQDRKNPYISTLIILFILLNIMKSYTFSDMRVAYILMAMYIFPYMQNSQLSDKTTNSIKSLDTQ